MREYIRRDDLLEMLNEKKNQWRSLKKEGQDVTHENFIDNVVLALEWVIDGVEKL